jgi:hypothetical protein
VRTLWSVAVFGLVPIPPADTPIRTPHDLRGASGHGDCLYRPIVKKMATEEELARIREELKARGALSTKHAHWCSVLLRPTWRRVHQTDSAGKNRRT